MTFAEPNEDFFREYLSKKDYSSSTKEGKKKSLYEKCQLLVVRHAFSEFNHAAREFYSQDDQNHEKFLDFWAGKHLLDPLLHQEGVDQAI